MKDLNKCKVKKEIRNFLEEKHNNSLLQKLFTMATFTSSNLQYQTPASVPDQTKVKKGLQILFVKKKIGSKKEKKQIDSVTAVKAISDIVASLIKANDEGKYNINIGSLKVFYQRSFVS